MLANLELNKLSISEFENRNESFNAKIKELISDIDKL